MHPKATTNLKHTAGSRAVDLRAEIKQMKRELREETGLVAGSWDFLSRVHLSNSITDEVGYVYVARDLQAGPSTPDGTEELEIRRLPFEEALAMALAGRITDSLSVIGLLLTERWLRGERFSIT